MDAFTTLGLTGDASLDDIKARWRQLSMEHHPDRGGDPAKFHAARLAYKEAYAEAMARPCQLCNGTGKVWVVRGFSSISMPCQACS